MSSPNLLTFTDADYKSEVLASPLPTLVEFGARWCGPCRQIAPTLAALADDYRGRVRIGVTDVDDHPRFATAYGVRSMPTLLLFHHGQVIGQIVGAVPRARLEALIAKAFEPARASLPVSSPAPR